MSDARVDEILGVSPPPDVVGQCERLRPQRGETILVHLGPEDDQAGIEALAEQLGEIAQRTRATILLMPHGTRVERLDESDMLARGWRKVGVLAREGDV